MNHRSPLLRFAVLVLAVSVLSACTGGNSAPVPAAQSGPQAALKPTRDTIKGRAMDSSGKPLAGVSVSINGITQAGSYASPETKTAADGTYSLTVPEGDFAVDGGTLPVKYNGRNYKLRLTTADEDTKTHYSSKDGIVRDLVLKISGMKAGYTDQYSEASYYGASLILTQYKDAKTDPLWGENWTAEITLTPSGPLIDGSTGKPIVYKIDKTTKLRILDIPIGDYVATAKLLTANGRPLRVAVSEGNLTTTAQYGDSAQVQFPAGAEGIKPTYLIIRPD